MNTNPLPLFDAGPPISEAFSPEANIVLYPGDTQALLATLPDESVDLVVTSPPYNIGKAYETRTALDCYLEQQAQVITHLTRVLKGSGSICWQVGNYVEAGEVFPLDIYFYDIFKRLGMRLRNRIVWYFGHGLHAQNRFSGRYETLLWFTKGDQYTFNLDEVRVPAKYPGKRHYKGERRGQLSGNPKGKNPTDVWEMDPALQAQLVQEWETGLWEMPNVKANHPEKTNHPAQFPIALAERCVLAFTNPGDWLLDPYAGVGSSLIAAIRHGRRAMGAEQMPEYVSEARRRIAAYYDGTLPYRPMNKPIFVPTGREKVAQFPDEWRETFNQEPPGGSP